MYEDIGDYALLSDCRSAALVSRLATIAWSCFPRFDSPACFASLVGSDKNGSWAVLLDKPIVCQERRYLEATMVLETQLHTSTGGLKITDCLVMGVADPTLVRKFKVLHGTIKFMSRVRPRFDYGSIVPLLESEGDRQIRAIAGADAITVSSSRPLRTSGHDIVSRHELSTDDDSIYFQLCWRHSHQLSPVAIDPEWALNRTQHWWQDWAAKCSYRGDWQKPVLRSALTLKALTYAPTGAIVAAPTTSIPESPGGERNWDYRFVWLRDCALTLSALLQCGYLTEAQAWRDWLERTVGGDPESIRPLYTVTGVRRIAETELRWLDGFAGSLPVREGNAATDQFQLDIYGEVFAALSFARRAGLKPGRESSHERALKLLAFLTHAWREPDEGIWEVRGGRRHFTFSKVMAWVAFSAALEEGSNLKGPHEEWRRARDEIHRQICERGFCAEKNSFAQHYDSDVLDASLLLLPLVGFLPPDDPRVIGTLCAIEAELRDEHGLVQRYATGGDTGGDGLHGQEGAFLPCSFWLVDNWVLQGRLDEARAFFEKLLSLGNDLGLFAEEYDSRAHRMLGNFPQAFTHVALIHSAFALTEGKIQSGRRPGAVGS